MAVMPRKTKNKRNAAGQLTGRAGTVYDINIKYKVDGKWKQYVKKGILSKNDALEHETTMKAMLSTSAYVEAAAMQSKQTVQEYLEVWVEHYGRANLRPVSFDGYKRCIRYHIVPAIGHVQLNSVTPEMLELFFRQMLDNGLPSKYVHYTLSILNLAFEAARKYYYVETNPARGLYAKFPKDGKPSALDNAAQTQQLMEKEME